jgi:hypothetical protein
VLRDKFQWDGYMLQDARVKLLALGIICPRPKR